MTDGNDTPPQSPPPQNPKRPDGPNVKMSRNVVSWLVLLGLAMLLVALLNSTMMQPKDISISEFDTLIRNESIQSIRIKEDGSIEGTKTGLSDGNNRRHRQG